MVYGGVVLIVPAHGNVLDASDTNVLHAKQALHYQRANRSPVDYGNRNIIVKKLSGRNGRVCKLRIAV